jgi:putative ABC transport system permease protein
MRISDYIEQAGANLWRKKLRTFLTTTGVVIGIGALVCMFAFGQGIQRNITDQFNKLDLFNYVNVVARNRGGMPASYDPDDPDAGMDGADDPAAQSPSNPQQAVPGLDARFLEEVAAIDGVIAALPEMRFPAQIRLGDREEFTLVQVLSATASQSGLVQFRAGGAYASDEPNELVISDSFLHRLGVKEVETAVGREIEVATLTLDFSLGRLLRMVLPARDQTLPFARESYRFKIVGVAERMGFGGSMPVRSDAYIPPGAAARMHKLALTSIWDFFKPTGQADDYSMVSVKVESPKDVAPVKKELESRGYRTFALMDQLDHMRIGFLIMDMFLIAVGDVQRIFFFESGAIGLIAVGMIGITVASLGIVNTMVMSILERYREIGIMKAVGATDGDVQRIFFFESGAIGLLGGLFGLFLAAATSFVINEVINGIMARQGAPRMAYFSFPWWLCLGAILFSILVSLMAGIYPTRRAARVDPVVALRHD